MEAGTKETTSETMRKIKKHKKTEGKRDIEEEREHIHKKKIVLKPSESCRERNPGRL